MSGCPQTAVALYLLTGLGKQKLIHDDVVCIDFIGGEFLYKPLRLVQRQEFGYAHANKRRLFLHAWERLHERRSEEGRKPPENTHGIFKLRVHFGDHRAH